MDTLDQSRAAVRESIDSVRDARGRRSHRHAHQRGLILVGAFKLSKAIFFAALGAGALHLLHRNLGEFVLKLSGKLPIDPEGHFINLVMERANLVGAHQIRQFSFATLAYAVLCLIEGTGLILEKVWAEYITITLTVIALPWEIYELVAKFSFFRVAVLLINLLVLGYLIWIIHRKRQSEAAAVACSNV